MPANNNLYGFPQPFSKASPAPIIAQRAPTGSDFAYPIGQLWVDEAGGGYYGLVAVAANTANWEALASGGGAGFPITPYVVGPAGVAGYQTIQSALDAANSAGGGAVYITQGSYVENLVLYDQVNMLSVPGISQGTDAGVLINGTHTPPNSGHIVIDSCCLVSHTDVFFSASAGTAHIQTANCEFAVENGYLFNLPNWAGILEIYDCNPSTAGAPWAINDGGINNTGGAQIVCYNSGLGAGTNIMTISGVSFFGQAVSIGCPLNLVTGASITSVGSQYNGTITIDDDTVFNSYNDSFVTGSDAVVVMSSSANSSIASATVQTSNDPAIDGTGSGTLQLTTISFLDNANVAGTLTVAYGVTLSGVDYLQNISFDGGTTTLDTDGQLWVGSSTGVPAAANITSTDNSITITNGANTIDLATVTGISNFPITPYVVGPSGAGGYQTIQDALDAANIAGGGIVYVQPGTYTEDLTTYGNTQVVGTPATSDDNQDPNNVLIIGVHVPPVSPDNGNFAFANVLLQSASHVFSSTDAGAASLYCNNCAFNISGYIYNLVNWLGVLGITGGLERSADNGVVNNNGGANCQFNNFSGGAGVTYPMITSGYVGLQNTTLSCAWNATLDTNMVVQGCLLYRIVTLTDNANGSFDFSTFSPQASAALVMNSAADISLTSCKIITGNNPAIDGSGAGILTLTAVDFVDGSVIAGTLTLSTGTIGTGSLKFLTAGNKITTPAATTITAGDNAYGKVTLVGGTIVVSTTAVTTSSIIHLTAQALGTIVTPAALAVTARVAGTSFTIKSSAGTDTSSIGWQIVN